MENVRNGWSFVLTREKITLRKRVVSSSRWPDVMSLILLYIVIHVWKESLSVEVKIEFCRPLGDRELSVG